jgi:hypothetical protein
MAASPESRRSEAPTVTPPAAGIAAARPFMIAALPFIAAAVVARLLHLNLPLDRDEGGYAYTAQLMLQGIPPYLLASNVKLPGVPVIFALVMALLGQTASALHLALLCANLAAATALLFLGRRRFGAPAGWIAAAGYALMSLGTGVLGPTANVEHFVALAALLGGLLLLRWQENPRRATLVSSGLFFGLAVVMRQTGAAFAVFGALHLLWMRRSVWRRNPHAVLAELCVFGAAVAAPVLVLCLVLWQAGVFANFWFWTVTYARAYGGITDLGEGFRLLADNGRDAAGEAWPLWLGALAGLAAVWRDRKHREEAVWASGFLVFSFLALAPGLYFRNHYFVLLLPALALLLGAAAAAAAKRLPARIAAGVFATLLAAALPSAAPYFQLDDKMLCRRMFGRNPFPEAAAIAGYIRSHGSDGDRVVVAGSEPEINFYAHRLSVTQHIYAYPLVEPQPFAARMQQEMIHDIETAKPAYIVFVDVNTSWLHPETPNRVVEWLPGYMKPRYDPVGVADIISPEETRYAWDAAAAAYKPQSRFVLKLFRRREYRAPQSRTF